MVKREPYMMQRLSEAVPRTTQSWWNSQIFFSKNGGQKSSKLILYVIRGRLAEQHIKI